MEFAAIFYSGKRELTQRTVNLEIKPNELTLGLVYLRYPGRQRHPAQSEKKNMNSERLRVEYKKGVTSPQE